MRSIRTTVLVATLLLVATACSGDPTPEPSSSSGTPSAAPSSSTSEVPDPTLSPGKRASRYIGTVAGSRDLGECLLLRTGSTVYVLVGDTGGLAPGDEAEVSAVADPDAATVCQQGPALRVVEVVSVGG